MNILPLIGICAVGTGILTFFYRRGKALEKVPISYEQFLDQLSRQIDENMLSEEKKNNVVMYGGECEISIPKSDPENVVMNIILYSKKNGSDKWIKSNITQKLGISEFTDDPDTLAKLESLKKQPERLKVTRPEKE